MNRLLAICLTLFMCLSAFPEQASAQSGVRKVEGPHRTGKKRPSKRSSDVRKVKKTRKVKRHYRKPHRDADSHSSNADAADTIFGVFQLVGGILTALEEIEEYESEDEYYEGAIHEENSWDDEPMDTHLELRVSTGAAFRFVDGYYDESHAGLTYGTRIGIGSDFVHLGLALDVDDYSAFGGAAILMFRPGVDLLISPIDTGWPVKPVFGLGMGGFFDAGPDSASVAGVTFDLEGGLAIDVSEKVNISLTAQIDILNQPEEDEYGESSLGVIGLRQSFNIGTGFAF